MFRVQGVSFAVGVLVTLGLLVPSAASAHRVKVAPKFAQGHVWRQGVVPRRDVHGATSGSSGNNLSYGGGTSGVGVTTGAPKVYLIFWGSQWGTQGTNSSGYATFSGDSKAMAPDLEAFFNGLGTNGEAWSGVMTQYCQNIAQGSQDCSSSNQHVGYPTGGALAGVWEDTSAAAPSQATAHQLAVEAVNAASHFNDFSNNSEYFIVSPSGTHPDGFNTLFGQFCAWHDYTADSSLNGGAASSPNGPVAFTNMPYVTDAGASCGQSFVNSGSAGTLDGVTIVGGHEYAETLTDTFPAGGWTDSSGNETGDKCAWINSSTSGANSQSVSQDITLSTGTFAVQSTWANDYNSGAGGCEVSHAVISNGPSVTVIPPSNQTNTAGDSVSGVTATADEGSNPCVTCSFTASGLPAGLTMSSGGVVSGTPTKAGTFSVTVTATDSNPAYSAGSGTFSWTVNPGAAARVSVSPTNPQVGLGQSQLFTATAADSYGNPVSASSATWTTTAPGTITSGPSTSATFTASSSTTGPGTVTATVGSASGSASVTVTSVANAIANGGFETGVLAPWTASGVSGAEKVVGAPSYSCHGGTYCAQLGLTTPTNGSSSIAQSFTAPSGSSSVSFYYEVVCPDTVQYDWATAMLKDTTSNTTYTVLGRTCNNNHAWVNVSHSLTAGHKYTLTLTSKDDNYPSDPTYTLYDDISVQ